MHLGNRTTRGHHVLHLNPTPDPLQREFSDPDLTEYQAHMFAAALVVHVKDEKEREDLVEQNPEPAAYFLGAIVASAKSSFDAQSSELTQASANIVLLDRVLAHYGPETKEVREILRGAVSRIIEDTWSHSRHASSQFGGASVSNEVILEKIQALSPETEFQRTLKSQAWNMTLNLGQMRWLLYAQGASAVSKPMVVIMVFWLTIVFVSWGVFAPRNRIVVATLFTAALSVSGAIFLILEMYSPFRRGVIQIPSAALQGALALLGQ